MEVWWHGLGFITKGFVIAALFFSVLFLWQLIMTFLGVLGDFGGDTDHAGMDHDTGADVHHDVSTDSSDHHVDSDHSFTLISFRSLLAFATLFSWSGMLYLMSGTSLIVALIYSFFWGVAALVAVSYLVYWLLRLQEHGTSSVWTSIGEDGVVYINIPATGLGKVRVMVSGIVSFVNAASRSGEPLPAGTTVRVVGVIDDHTIEVEATEQQKGL